MLFAAYLCGGKGYSFSTSSKNQNKPSLNIKSSRNNYWYVINGGEPSQLLVPQLYKSVHFIKGVFVSPKNFVLCIKYLNFFSGGGKNGRPNSQQLLLFPFHVFW